MRLGIAHHLGWAVAITVAGDHQVVDRRRFELIEPGLPAAPIHHQGGAHCFHGRGKHLDDEALATLVAKVRASVVRATAAELDALEGGLLQPIVSLSLRTWLSDFPTDIALQRRVPYESRADSVMYLEVLAELGQDRGWSVSFYEAKSVETEARRVLGDRAQAVLDGPRAALGPPWSKDHRTALAATVLLAEDAGA
jgi:hypothetical protein